VYVFCGHQPYDRRIPGHHPPPVPALVVERCVTGTAKERLVLRQHRFRERRHCRSESDRRGRAKRRRLRSRCSLLHTHLLLLDPAPPADDQSARHARRLFSCPSVIYTPAIAVDVMGVSDFTCRDRIRCVCSGVTYVSFQAGKHWASGGASNAASASHRESGPGGWSRGPCRAQSPSSWSNSARPFGPTATGMSGATFRRSFATHLLADGSSIRTVQDPLRHNDVKATVACTHVLNRGPAGVRSRSTDFETIAEVFMPICIRRHDKNARLWQPVDVAGLRPALPAHSRASYTALQTGFGVLGGSA